MKPIDMLAEVLRRATLNPSQRETFEGMWDQLHRAGRCSNKQKAWIEDIYFKQKLDQPAAPRRRVVIPTWQKDQPVEQVQKVPSTPPALEQPKTPVAPPQRQVLIRNRPKTGTFMATPTVPPSRQVGYINHAGVQREEMVTNLAMFEELCPGIEQGSRQHQKVALFFKNGGVILKVKPVAAARVA